MGFQLSESWREFSSLDNFYIHSVIIHHWRYVSSARLYVGGDFYILQTIIRVWRFIYLPNGPNGPNGRAEGEFWRGCTHATDLDVSLTLSQLLPI